MISLNWSGKQNLNTIYSNTSSKTLHYSKELSYGENTTNNLIIKGDNLEVLSLLLSNYREKVKCIYIDPPYNSCKLEDIMYNDKKNKKNGYLLCILE